MSYRKITNPDRVWHEWFSTSAFGVDKDLRRVFRILPHDPRCKFCNAPFEGLGGSLVRVLFGKQRSALNPRFCNMCDEASRMFPGGNEVEMSMLFADVRGSTALSEKMSPTEFSKLINRFYTRLPKPSPKRTDWWRSWPAMRSRPFGAPALPALTTCAAP
jgi:hypothetical protein